MHVSINRTTTAGALVAVAASLGSGLVLPEPAFGQTVGDRALSDVRADLGPDCAAMTINLNLRVQVLSSFPTQGRELHVRLRPLDPSFSAKGRDSLRPPAGVPELRSIEYEGDSAGGPVLSLFFTEDRQFEVTAGSEPQEVVIRIARPGAATACAAQTGAASPTPTLVQQGSEADAARTASLIADAENAIRDNAIDRAVQLLTLGASQLSIDVWRGPDLIERPSLVRRPDIKLRDLSAFTKRTVASLALTGNAYWLRTDGR